MVAVAAPPPLAPAPQGTAPAGDPPGDPGSARARRRPGRRLPRVAGGAARRVHRRRRLLRHLRLSHHRAAAPRARATRAGLAVAFWARRARRILPAALVTLFVCAAATIALVPDKPVAAVPRRDAREHALRGELAARLGRRRLLRGRRAQPVARAALLVAVGGGAVLPPVAGRAAGRRARGGGRSLVAHRPCSTASASATRCYDDRGEPGRRVLLDAGAGVGVRRRRAARAGRRPRAAVAGAVLGRARGDRRRRAGLHAATPFPGRGAGAGARRAWP